MGCGLWVVLDYVRTLRSWCWDNAVLRDIGVMCRTVMDRVICDQLAPIIGRITTLSAFADGEWRTAARSWSLGPAVALCDAQGCCLHAVRLRINSLMIMLTLRLLLLLLVLLVVVTVFGGMTRRTSNQLMDVSRRCHQRELVTRC